jgi:hypothetical protein
VTRITPRWPGASLPPYARRSKSLEVLIPILYLKGISTGGFEVLSPRPSGYPEKPIDGHQLCDLLKQLKLGVHTEMVDQMTVQPGWFDQL